MRIIVLNRKDRMRELHTVDQLAIKHQILNDGHLRLIKRLVRLDQNYDFGVALRKFLSVLGKADRFRF